MEKVGVKQLIVGGVFLLIGIYMLFNPIGSFNIFTSILGVVTILFGSNELISLIRSKQRMSFQKLFNYLAIVFGGVIMVVAREQWKDVIGYVISAFFLIAGITKMFEHYKRREMMHSTISIYGVIMTFFGLVMLFNPEVGVGFFTAMLSISLIFAGFSQLMIGIAIRKFSSFTFNQGMDQFNEDINEQKPNNTTEDVIDVEFNDID
ncbi:DUF308 domain-containing protein [Mycoplasmatota bacterium WC44]